MTPRTKMIAGVSIVFILAMAAAITFRERNLLAACRTVPDADQAQYRAAADFFAQANKAISSRNYSTANDLLDIAAAKLGDVYQMGAAPDDTGLALEAGRAEAARSDFQLAARMKQSALQTRLSMFRRKQHLSERCHGILGKIGLG